MATFAKVWQDEVRRLARKETKIAVDALRRDQADLKKQNTLLRKRLADLDKKRVRGGGTTPVLDAPTKRSPAPAPPVEIDGDGPKLRVSSKTVRMLRERLGLTQADFATLLGVTGQSVYQWEHKEGRINMRRGTVDAFARIRDMGSREARRRLDDMAG